MRPLEPQPPAERDAGRRFSPAVTIAFALALLTFVALLSGVPGEEVRLRALQRPFATAQRVFERDLAIDEGLERRSAWVRRALAPALGQRTNVREDAIAAWQEIEAKLPLRSEPDLERDRLMACRAVLCAEAGRLDELPGELERLREHGHGAFVAALQGAYDITANVSLDAEALALLGDGFCASLARERVARRTSDDARASAIAAERRADADRRAARAVAFASAYAALFGLGLTLVLVWLARDRPKLVEGSAALPPAWSFEAGFAVLVRAAFFGVAIVLVGSAIDVALGARSLAAWGTLVAALPMLALARKHLLAPNGTTFASALGLRAFARPFAWIAILLGTFAIEQLGVQAIGAGLAQLGVAPHWTERTLESFVFGSGGRAAIESLDLVVWTPLFEEIGFRGLLFLTLRRVQPPWKAALFSSALFAVLHVESLPGALGVGWSGFVWALALERSKSIAPGLFCHALDNGLAVVALVIAYR